MSPLLVTAVVHISSEHWGVLEESLARTRALRSLPTNFVFHFSGSRPQIREALFIGLRDVPLKAHARVLDKRLWTQPHIRATSGDARIRDEIVQLIVRCPDMFLDGKRLLIDGAKSDLKMIGPIRTEISRRLGKDGRAGLRRIRLCPDDHPTQGAIIQVADMIAGALHDCGAVAGPYLSGFESKIVLV